MKLYVYLLCVVLVTIVSCNGGSDSKSNENQSESAHPSLILTQQGVKDIKANLGSIPIFDETLAATKKEIDAEIKAGFDVPTPKDYSGAIRTLLIKKLQFNAKSRCAISNPR